MSTAPNPAPQNALAAAQVGEPIRVVIEGNGPVSRFMRWLPWALLILAVLTIVGLQQSYKSYMNLDNAVDEKYHSLDDSARDKIAIIKVSGVIMTGEGYVKQQIDAVRRDENVKAIVLRVDSPGGTITGSHSIYHQLRKLSKEKKLPIVVSMGSLAASGGYYVAMASGADWAELNMPNDQHTIFAEPTTTTGSIGVILPHYNIEGLMKEWKIETDSVKSHPLKDMGSLTRKMTEEERAKFQAYIDDSFKRFKEIVAFGRPKLAQADIDKVATGEIFTTNQALALKLVDEEGYIEDAINQAIKLAGLNADKVRVVQYERPQTLMHALTDIDTKAVTASRSNLEMLLDMTTPRAYYLFSSLPSVAVLGPKAE